MITLYNDDCFNIFPQIPDKSIDTIICDTPYQKTRLGWDSHLDLDKMWQEIWRITKKNSAIVLFCNQPYSSILINSQIKYFKYCWAWDKKIGRGHLVAKHRPLQQTEEIAVFSKNRACYNPIMEKMDKPRKLKEYNTTEIMTGKKAITSDYERITDERYPKTLLHFPFSPAHSFHPTEKPVDLLEYLVKTHSFENDTILDFTMGSGSTGVACKNLNRNFIGIEKDEKYFDIANRRINFGLTIKEYVKEIKSQ